MIRSKIEGGNDFCMVHFRDKKLRTTRIFNNIPALSNYFSVGRVYEICNAVVNNFKKEKVCCILNITSSVLEFWTTEI